MLSAVGYAVRLAIGLLGCVQLHGHCAVVQQLLVCPGLRLPRGVLLEQRLVLWQRLDVCHAVLRDVLLVPRRLFLGRHVVRRYPGNVLAHLDGGGLQRTSRMHVGLQGLFRDCPRVRVPGSRHLCGPERLLG